MALGVTGWTAGERLKIAGSQGKVMSVAFTASCWLASHGVLARVGPLATSVRRTSLGRLLVVAAHLLPQGRQASHPSRGTRPPSHLTCTFGWWARQGLNL